MKCPSCGFIEKDKYFGTPPKCPKCELLYEDALKVRSERMKAELEKAVAIAESKKEEPKSSVLRQRIQAAAAPKTPKPGVVPKPSSSKAGLKRSEKTSAESIDGSMPFKSMVVLMLRWALASIPAACILFVVFLAFYAVVRALFG